MMAVAVFAGAKLAIGTVAILMKKWERNLQEEVQPYYLEMKRIGRFHNGKVVSHIQTIGVKKRVPTVQLARKN